MNAARIAKLLKAQGITVLSSSEGDHDLDGEVTITERVSVQVPTYDRFLQVCAMNADGEEFTHYAERKATDIVGVVADIRKACATE